jgi:hypothetical protein
MKVTSIQGRSVRGYGRVDASAHDLVTNADVADFGARSTIGSNRSAMSVAASPKAQPGVAG